LLRFSAFVGQNVGQIRNVSLSSQKWWGFVIAKQKFHVCERMNNMISLPQLIRTRSKPRLLVLYVGSVTCAVIEWPV